MPATIFEVLHEKVKPHIQKIAIILVLAIFAWASYYAYTKWGTPQKKDKLYTEIHQPTGSRDVNIYLFFADWCPHCTKAKPEWEKFEADNNGKTINDWRINCIQVDCSDSSEPEAANMINKFGITTYPTIKMMRDNEVYEFDAKITAKNLEEFVNLTKTIWEEANTK